MLADRNLLLDKRKEDFMLNCNDCSFNMKSPKVPSDISYYPKQTKVYKLFSLVSLLQNVFDNKTSLA